MRLTLTARTGSPTRGLHTVVDVSGTAITLEGGDQVTRGELRLPLAALHPELDV